MVTTSFSISMTLISFFKLPFKNFFLGYFYFWLHSVVAVHRLSLVAASSSCALVVWCGLLIVAVSLAAEQSTDSRAHGLCGCVSRA